MLRARRRKAIFCDWRLGKRDTWELARRIEKQSNDNKKVLTSKKVEVRGLETLSCDDCASEIQTGLAIVPGV
jgi:hypothetical protein